MTVPDWVQDAIFYQIFPDRFANGDRSIDPPKTQRWGSLPKTWGFQGGDFKGIMQRFDYLLDLGVNAIYFTPIFQATSNHRYNASDYFAIDSKLGDISVFRSLLDMAHCKGVRVILDGVFNHCGRGFFAFQDILENQRQSPYKDWFHIRKFPVDAYSAGPAKDYLAWWKIKSLPKFNTDNPAVRSYLFSAARYWIEQGADGWRLDVPNEIDDDSFWAEFRFVVKSINPQAYILGEIWTAESRWVGENHFDGLMNYPVRTSILDLLNNGNLNKYNFIDDMKNLATLYSRDNFFSMYVPLGSHDTERLLTKLEENVQKTKLAFFIQFSLPGAPAVYYGDEIGLKGEKDPGCRGAFPWNEKLWDRNLRLWVKNLISVRKDHEALRRGDLFFLSLDASPEILAFVRKNNDSQILVVINASDQRRQFDVPIITLGGRENPRFISLLSKREYNITQEAIRISLEPWSGDWIK